MSAREAATEPLAPAVARTPAHDALLQGPDYETYAAFTTLTSQVKGGEVAPRWEEGDVFTFVDLAAEAPVTYRVDPGANTKVAVAPAEAAAAKEETSAGSALARVAAAFGGPVSAPDGRYAVDAKNDNLVLTWTADNRSAQLTTDGHDDCSWSVARSLPGGELNPTWAPNSFRLVATETDKSGVGRSPVVRWLKDREEVEWRSMSRPGERTSRTTLHIVDVRSRTTKAIEGTGLEDHSYYPVGWHPDGAEYLFMRMDRRMQCLDLLAADAATGASRVLITDTSETFIAGLDFHMRYPRYVRLVANGEQIIWVSERDGWDHLYLYDRNGKELARLTEGAFPVLNVIEVDEPNGWVYLTAHSDKSRPYDVHLCRVDLDGKGFTQLTEGPGCHHTTSFLMSQVSTANDAQIQFSPSKQFFLDTWSSPTEAPRTELRRADGTLLQTLSEANVDALRATGWTAPEEFVAKAADGETDLHGLICYPPSFSRDRRYPVLDYIYNGPFVSWVPHTFSAALQGQGQLLAQGGFVVVIVDGRGTIGRGKAFQDVVYMNWGRHEIPDHEASIRAAAEERPFMDLDRVGVFGGSWGGYMTQRALLQAPDFFKVGVASASVSDLYDHTLNMEWYVGLPQDHREVYDYASNILLADQLRGKLLLVHGTLDLGNAPFSATMKMADALIRAGKQFDLMVIPEMAHAPATPAHRKFLNDLHFRYFTDHLK